MMIVRRGIMKNIMRTFVVIACLGFVAAVSAKSFFKVGEPAPNYT